MAAQQNFRSAFNGFNREDVVHYIEYLNSRHTAEINQLKSEVEYLQGKAPQDSDNSDHADRIQELLEQNKALKEELEALRAEAQPDVSIEEQLNTVTAERDDLSAKLEEARSQLDFVTDERNDLAAELDNTLQQLSTVTAGQEQRLPSFVCDSEPTAQLQEALNQLKAVTAERDSLRAALREEQRHVLYRNSEFEKREDDQRRSELSEQLAKERTHQMFVQASGVIGDATARVNEAAAQISDMSKTVIAKLQSLRLAVASSTDALEEASATVNAICQLTENRDEISE